MCHLILLLPVIALPVFWLWSWPVAVTVYALVLVVSGWTYVYAMLAMRRPVVSGVEQTVHSRGVVVNDTPGALRVRVNSENWAAECSRPVHKGDPVAVIGHEGLTLIVQPAPTDSSTAGEPPPPPDMVPHH